MRTSAVILLACLLLLDAEGFAIAPRRRCLCFGPGVKFIRAKTIRKIRLHQPSTFCEQMEIIVTLNNGVQKCVNPESEFGKKFVRNLQRNKREKKGYEET